MNFAKITPVSVIWIFLLAALNVNAQTDILPIQILFRQSAINYADAMIRHGRDTYGHEHSPLFASTLDRFSNTVQNSEFYGEIPGIRQSDRSLRGSNPINDRSLYELLYVLSTETNNPQYKQEADAAIQFFFDHCQSPTTGLMTWGEHIYWNFLTDTIGFESVEYHEASSWPFWDAVYRLNPDAAWRFAVGEWRHQVADSTGDFSRHARWAVHGPERGADFPRYAGQMIERWADAWSRPENADPAEKDAMLVAIETMVTRMEENLAITPAGHLPAFRGAAYAWTDSNLELARCLSAASDKLCQEDDRELCDRLKRLAVKLDSSILGAPHAIETGAGFASTLDAVSGLPIFRAMNKPYTSAWEEGYGFKTHAAFANACIERYKQLADFDRETALKYKKMGLAAADFYLHAAPDTNQILQPGVFADAIQLMMHAYSLTGNKPYREAAQKFALISLDIFFTDGSPLPKATNRHTHYESLTGGAALMLALFELGKLDLID